MGNKQLSFLANIATGIANSQLETLVENNDIFIYWVVKFTGHNWKNLVNGEGLNAGCRYTDTLSPRAAVPVFGFY
jgi:hypothetical protein